MKSELLQLEHEISSLIYKDNGATVHFEYNLGVEEDAEFLDTASVYTVNKNNKEVFLLKEVKAENLVLALTQVLSFLKHQKACNSYTVIWTKIGNTTRETSYFYCHDIKEVINNFFSHKEVTDYIVYEIKLNPVA